MDAASGYDFINRVLATGDALLRESRRFFRPFGLTAAQFNVLNILAGAPAGMSQRELSDVLVVDRSNVTTLLDRIARTGWVRCENHPRDRRAHCVTLTPAGRRLHARVWPRYLEAVGRAVAAIPAEEMRRAAATLAALEAGAQNRLPGKKGAGSRPAAQT